MNQYDTTFIIDGTLDHSQRESLIEKFEKSLEKLGGKLDRTVRWGLRELAYEINKRTHGYYVMFYFNAEPTVIKKFELELNLNEHILRYMTLLFDGKHPDYIKDETGQVPEPAAKVDVPAQPESLSEEITEVPVDDDSEVSVDDDSEVSGDNSETDAEGNVPAEGTDTSSPDTDNETGESVETEDSLKKEDE